MTMLDDSVMALRIQLHQLPCPACGAHELMPKLQCDYYPDGCLWFVSCGSCQTRYHLDHRTVPTWGHHRSGAVIGNDTAHPHTIIETKGGSHANP